MLHTQSFSSIKSNYIGNTRTSWNVLLPRMFHKLGKRFYVRQDAGNRPSVVVLIFSPVKGQDVIRCAGKAKRK